MVLDDNFFCKTHGRSAAGSVFSKTLLLLLLLMLPMLMMRMHLVAIFLNLLCSLPTLDMRMRIVFVCSQSDLGSG